MARFRVRVLGLVAVGVLVIGLAALSFWQLELLTAQAAQEDSTYVVKAGDSLYSISNRLGVSIESLAAVNGLPPHSILYKKQELIIPSADMSTSMSSDAVERAAPQTATEEVVIEQAEVEATEETDAEKAEEPEEVGAEGQAETMAVTESASPETTPSPRTYTVEAGDSLYWIAKEFGVTVQALAEANDLRPNSILFRRQVLVIPSGQTVTPEALSVPEAEPMAEPTAETTEEPTEEATVEAAEEPVAEATAEPTEEMVAEPTAEATEEATEEATVEAAEEPIAEATIEPTEEMMAEPTAEATEEATEEATVEATEEPLAEATAEPTEEATEEAIEEPIAEATTEPTEEPAPEVVDILDTLIALGNFGTLLEMLEAAGLTETLETEGPFTLFAPTDAAFAALPEGTIDGLLASSPDDLSQILLYHIAQGEITSADLADGTTIVTAQGAPLNVSVSETGIMVNDAFLTITDIGTSNGVIHVINAVLLPSGDTASVPIGTDAPTSPEAASPDAASVIIVPVPNVTVAAHAWKEPTDNIALFSPVAESGYHSPIEIIGLSRTFEGTIAINLVAADDTLLAQRMTLGGADEYAFFHTDLRFYVTETTEATLNVLEMDMADGSILNSVETPLILLPGQRVLDVTSPIVGQAACDPIMISGYSSTFEANVVLTLSDQNGQTLEQLPTMGGTLGTYRDFATPLPYTVNAATPLLVSVAEMDASDRFNTIDETIIPITLYPAYSAACY